MWGGRLEACRGFQDGGSVNAAPRVGWVKTGGCFNAHVFHLSLPTLLFLELGKCCLLVEALKTVQGEDPAQMLGEVAHWTEVKYDLQERRGPLDRRFREDGKAEAGLQLRRELILDSGSFELTEAATPAKLPDQWEKTTVNDTDT